MWRSIRWGKGKRRVELVCPCGRSFVGCGDSNWVFRGMIWKCEREKRKEEEDERNDEKDKLNELNCNMRLQGMRLLKQGERKEALCIIIS